MLESSSRLLSWTFASSKRGTGRAGHCVFCLGLISGRSDGLGGVFFVGYFHYFFIFVLIISVGCLLFVSY